MRSAAHSCAGQCSSPLRASGERGRTHSAGAAARIGAGQSGLLSKGNVCFDSGAAWCSALSCCQNRPDRHQLPQTGKIASTLPSRATGGKKMDLALTIAGVLLTAVGLIGLWPSLTVVPGAPFDPEQPFSVPFKITNSGYLPIRNLKTHCYVHRVSAGKLTAACNLLSDKSWNTAHLARSESITIITSFIDAPRHPAEADLAIVLDHNAFGIPFINLRNIFRFVGRFRATWQWLQQPSSEIKGEVDKLMSYWAERDKKALFR
jgi:hypothetical protein